MHELTQAILDVNNKGEHCSQKMSVGEANARALSSIQWIKDAGRSDRAERQEQRINNLTKKYVK